MNESMIERVVLIEAQARAAHERIDKSESRIVRDLGEIKDSLSILAKEMKEVVGWMNRSKGWAAAALFLATIGGVAAGILARAWWSSGGS